MLHVPSCLLCQSQETVHFPRGRTVHAIYEQVKAQEPFAEGYGRVLKGGVGPDAKLWTLVSCVITLYPLGKSTDAGDPVSTRKRTLPERLRRGNLIKPGRIGSSWIDITADTGGVSVRY